MQVTPEKLAPHLFGAAAGRRGAGRRARRPRSSRSRSSSPTSRPSSPSPGLYLEDLFVEPDAARPAASARRCSSGSRGSPRARLRPLRVERARLERRRDPLLPAHGRDRDARLAHLPHRRRRRWPRSPIRRVADAASIATPSCTPAFAGTCRPTSTSPRSAARAGRASAPDAVAIRFEHEDGARTDFSYGELRPRRRPARRGAAPARRRAAATASRSSCRSASRPRSRTSRSTGSARSRCRCRCCSAPTRSSTASTTARRGSRSSTRAASPTCVAARPLCPKLRDAWSRSAPPQGRATSTGARARRASAAASSPRRRSADDAAVLIYTSGTTGPPKGTLIPHRALIGNLPRLRLQPELVPAGRRRVLVARRLGLDRRPDGRAAADALLRPRDRRLPAAASRPSSRSS